MNKEYIYINGKAIITDENGNMTHVEYCDNLDNILVQENLVETIEKEISRLENESEKLKEEMPKHYIPMTPGFLLFMSISLTLLGILTGLNEASAAPTIFGISLTPIQFLNILVPLACSSGVLMFDIAEYRTYQKNRKRNKGISSTLAFLKNKLEKEKKYLESLKEEKTKNEEKAELKTTIVDDKKQLDVLDAYERLYFDLGYNADKYHKFYQQGELEEIHGKEASIILLHISWLDHLHRIFYTLINQSRILFRGFLF